MCAVLIRFEHQDRVWFLLTAQARQVRERGVRPEAVVAVVRTDFVGSGGDDEAFAGEEESRFEGACVQEVGDALAFGQLGWARGPPGSDELTEGGGLGLTGATFAAISHGLGFFFTHGDHSTVWGGKETLRV